MLKPENIPDELKTLPRWVCYRLPDKTPLNPRTGGNAGSTLPGTWADYETAAEAVTRLGCTGIGFVLGGGIVGIDVDHCIDSTTGELNEVAAGRACDHKKLCGAFAVRHRPAYSVPGEQARHRVQKHGGGV